MSKKQQNIPMQGPLNWRALRDNERIQSGAFTLTVIGLFFVALYVVYVGVGVLPRFAALAYEDDKENVRTVIVVLSGLIAFPFAIWRLHISNKQANASREQARIAQEAYFTSLFTKAVEQLGATRERKDGKESTTEPNLEVRIGAVYALQRIAEDSSRDRWPILETLAAYIRHRSSVLMPSPINNKESGRVIDSLHYFPFDAQAALNVLGKAKKKQHEVLNLSSVNFHGADLSGLDLESANFMFSAFKYTKMHSCNLMRANFSHVIDYHSSFANANLSSAEFRSSVFQHTNFHLSKIAQTNFINCRFIACEFKDCALSAEQMDGNEYFEEKQGTPDPHGA